MKNSLSPLVSIIILNFNGWRDTIECLESVLKIDYNNYKIVVVDNKSIDGSVSKIKQWADGNLIIEDPISAPILKLILPFSLKPLEINLKPLEFCSLKPKSISIIEAEKNQGFSAGNNIGINFSLKDPSCEFVWLLNNDTVVPPNCLKVLIGKSTATSKLGLLGSMLVYYSSPEIIQAIAGTINKNTGASAELGQGENQFFRLKPDAQFDYVVGASMFVKRKFIEDVGLLCEDYFLYNEEPDWCNRALKKGWNFDVCYESIVYHKHGSSTGSNSKVKSEIIDLIGLKSRLLFMQKFYPEKMTLVYISFFGVILNRIFRFQFKRIPKIFQLIYVNILKK